MSNVIEFARFWPFAEPANPVQSCACVSVEDVSPDGVRFRASKLSGLDAGIDGIIELYRDRNSVGFDSAVVVEVEETEDASLIRCNFGGRFAPVFAQAVHAPTSAQEYNAELVTLLDQAHTTGACLLYTSPSPRDATLSRMPSSA